MTADVQIGFTAAVKLAEEIEALFPQVHVSDMAVDGFPAKDAVAMQLVHRVLQSCGWEIEGMACKEPQLFFTAEDAIAALRYRFFVFFQNATDSLGWAPYALYWRNKPTYAEVAGCYRARMRFTPMWIDRDGALVTWQHDLYGMVATRAPDPIKAIKDLREIVESLQYRLNQTTKPPFWKRISRSRG